jgi:hypothetical protein
MCDGAVASCGNALGGRELRKEDKVIGMERCPTIELLTGAGWHLELAGTPHRLAGCARKEVDGQLLEVSADAPTLEELSWKLLARAAGALEQLDGRQAAAVAAA